MEKLSKGFACDLPWVAQLQFETECIQKPNSLSQSSFSNLGGTAANERLDLGWTRPSWACS